MLSPVPEADDRAEADRLRYEIEERIATGRARSSERDTRKLPSQIRRKCREVTGAEAGSVHVLEGEGAPAEKTLHFMLSQNDSMPIDFQELTLGVDETSIADLFDALTASDRPHKRAVPIDRALAIIESELEAGKVDGPLFEIFVKSETYEVVP
jgi:hypothetical protein